ncbi:MAG: hypothetical protein HND47_21065 [Chloroflexi bacterium]|nr:hypothetical protein [Chloroflexota bacterium]
MDSSRIIKFFPRLQDIFFAALFLAILLLGSRMINLDGDLPRHLLFGKYILENRTVPNTEPFIYPYEGRHYVSHEWLAQVVYYLVYAAVGLKGLVLLAAGLLSVTFYISYSYLVKRFSLRLPVLFLVGWGVAITSLNWAIRPHVFSMFLLAVWLILADELRRGGNTSIWQFPVLMILWSNLHGVFIAGVLVLFAFAAGWAVDYLFDSRNADTAIGKRLWLALLLSALASFLNPGGAGSWTSILGFVNNRYLMSRMLEANAPNFQLPEMRILLAFMAFSIFLLAFKREKLSAGQGFLLAGFTAMSLVAFRNIHLYGIVAPFVLAETLSETKNLKLVNRLENTLAGIETRITGSFHPIFTSIALAILVLISPLSSALYKFDPETFPVKAVDWLASNPQEGRTFNDLNWGGYLELHLFPEHKAFADSIADVTGDVTMEYETILTMSKGWEELMTFYNIEWAIIETDSDLAVILVEENGWNILYEDETAVILRK